MKLQSQSWSLVSERGPNCLYVRILPHHEDDSPPASTLESSPNQQRNISHEQTLEDVNGLGDTIWQLMTRHLVSRVVIELDQVSSLSEPLYGELRSLAHRIEDQQGMLRLCGLSAKVRAELQATDSQHFSWFASRSEAVLGDPLRAPNFAKNDNKSRSTSSIQ